MIKYEEFSDLLKKEILNYLPDEYKNYIPKVKTLFKINLEQEQFLLVNPDVLSGDLCPGFNMQGFYDYVVSKNLSNEEILTEAAANFVKAFEHYTKDNKPKEFVSISEDVEESKKKIFLTLVNAEKNKTLLQNAPHVKILDLAIIYKYITHSINKENTDEVATMIITNKLLDDVLKISAEELQALAMKNSIRDLGIQISPLFDVIKDIIKKENAPFSDAEIEAMRNDKNDMFIITNEEHRYGAALAFFEQTLDHAANIFNDNLYILPSSIHEVIVIPTQRAKAPIHVIREMVVEVNKQEVEIKDFLSDNVYYYDRNQKKLYIA